MGMELVVTKPRDTVETVRITKVEETRSEAIMTQAGEEEPGPKAGWRLFVCPNAAYRSANWKTGAIRVRLATLSGSDRT